MSRLAFQIFRKFLSGLKAKSLVLRILQRTGQYGTITDGERGRNIGIELTVQINREVHRSFTDVNTDGITCRENILRRRIKQDVLPAGCGGFRIFLSVLSCIHLQHVILRSG